MRNFKRRDFLTLATAATLSGYCGLRGNADAVRKELRRQVESGLIHGGVCGAVGGDMYWDGLQWFSPVQKPMSKDSIFDLASVGKTFTAFLCAKLYGDGKLDPDAPFTEYLPQHVLAKENCKITVRDLAMHIGGFDNSKPYIVNDPQKFNRLLYAKRPAWARGKIYRYACSNYIYLGRIFENISGLDLEAGAKKFIWDPLGMSDTCWHNIPNHPYAAQSSLNGSPQIGTKGDEQARAYGKAMGNGAAFSTTSDMLKFVNAILNRKLLSKEAYELMFTCRYEGGDARRSFGWDMSRIPEGWSKATISHGGFTGNTIAVDPVNGFAGVVLTNRKGDRLKGYAGHLTLLSLMTK